MTASPIRHGSAAVEAVAVELARVSQPLRVQSVLARQDGRGDVVVSVIAADENSGIPRTLEFRWAALERKLFWESVQ